MQVQELIGRAWGPIGQLSMRIQMLRTHAAAQKGRRG